MTSEALAIYQQHQEQISLGGGKRVYDRGKAEYEERALLKTNYPQTLVYYNEATASSTAIVRFPAPTVMVRGVRLVSHGRHVVRDEFSDLRVVHIQVPGLDRTRKSVRVQGAGQTLPPRPCTIVFCNAYLAFALSHQSRATSTTQRIDLCGSAGKPDSVASDVEDN